MLRTTLVSLFCQNRTFTPRLTSKIALHVEELACNIAKKHSDTTTQSDIALTDLAELRNVEHDLEQCRQSLNAERTAVTAAINILNGEPVFYMGDHPLVRHAEDLSTQTTAVKVVDSCLSVLDLSEEIQLLTELAAELDDAATVANNRIERAIEGTRKARGLAVCRCKDVSAAIQNFPSVNPLPQTGDWLKVDPQNTKTIVNKCRLAAKADRASWGEKRKKIVKQIADKSLANLKENN
jgi:hypothetical protein